MGELLSHILATCPTCTRTPPSIRRHTFTHTHNAHTHTTGATPVEAAWRLVEAINYSDASGVGGGCFGGGVGCFGGDGVGCLGGVGIGEGCF